jgi:hypothetical protein
VTLPASVRPLQINGNRILGVDIDEVGVERIVIHEIEVQSGSRDRGSDLQ